MADYRRRPKQPHLSHAGICQAWGYPMPEAMALGELWMAQKLYPDRFRDIDMQKQADAYYREFYRTDYRAAP